MNHEKETRHGKIRRCFHKAISVGWHKRLRWQLNGRTLDDIEVTRQRNEKCTGTLRPMLDWFMPAGNGGNGCARMTIASTS